MISSAGGCGTNKKWLVDARRRTFVRAGPVISYYIPDRTPSGRKQSRPKCQMKMHLGLVGEGDAIACHCNHSHSAISHHLLEKGYPTCGLIGKEVYSLKLSCML